MKKLLFGLLFSLFATGMISTAAIAQNDSPGSVCAMTNATDDNQLLCYQRNAKGILSDSVLISTGGQGSGGGLDPLGSQGSLIFSPNGMWLLAVNAGSDDISVFRTLSNGPVPVELSDSGGDFPVSITIFHNLVYVLNGGTDPNITGFFIDHAGQLTPIPGSTRNLGSGAFAQIGFDPRGGKLVVTDRGEKEILVFGVENDGTPSATPVITTSSGDVPFGFIFNQDHLLVSEAGSGAVTSYEILPDLTLQILSESVANGQVATCWIDGNSQYAFTANTGSSNISSYSVKRGHGTIELVDAMAGYGNLDIDISITPNGRFLYALNAGSGTIGMFRIEADGSLEDLGMADEVLLEIFTQGIAAN